MAALGEHKTQISMDGPFFALSNNLGNKVWGYEYYTLVKGAKNKKVNEKGWETDLFPES
jgi:N-acetyl-1-D-myo-inositol-2-amino-2-deoxy-alpha-D-glucopyranoside deacetylase